MRFAFCYVKIYPKIVYVYTNQTKAKAQTP